jgi:hypothetical protein
MESIFRTKVFREFQSGNYSSYFYEREETFKHKVNSGGIIHGDIYEGKPKSKETLKVAHLL